MTAFDRVESRLPELMDELASASVPDYFDDMLQRATQTRQRPAWSALERWIPMGVIARTRPMRPFPWRAVGILALLAILITVGAVLLAGSQRRLPTPFGVARNGSVVFSTAAGDIAAADVLTGAISPLITGPEGDSDPWFTNDGTRFAFDRSVPGDGRALTIANADGSNVHRLLAPDAPIISFDWSPDGKRIALTRDGGPAGLVTIVDATDGTTTSFRLDMDVINVTWRPNHDELIISGEVGGPNGAVRTYSLVGADGTGLRPINVLPAAINQATVSPDGSKIAYSTWETGAEGRTHIVDIDSGVDSGALFDPGVPYTDLSPSFSPDGTKLLVERYLTDGYRLTVVPVDGRGPAVAMGAVHPEMTNGAKAIFSPDGTKVLATYQDDGSTWVLDTVTAEARQMTWPTQLGTSATWQRLAP